MSEAKQAQRTYDGPDEDAEMPHICMIDDSISKLQQARRFYDQPSPKFSQAEGCIEDAIAELKRIPFGRHSYVLEGGR